MSDAVIMDRVENCMEDVLISISKAFDENRKIENDAIRASNLIIIGALETFALMAREEICKETDKYD